MAVVIDHNGNVMCNAHVCTEWKYADIRCGNCPMWNCVNKIIELNADEVFNIASPYLQTY